jgi:hypothetical protein
MRNSFCSPPRTPSSAVSSALGVYLLPVLIAPEAPSTAEVAAAAQETAFKGEFRRDLRDSDPLHWGEGTVTVGRQAITLMGKVAPGPDYKLYLSPEFVETEADFMRLAEWCASATSRASITSSSRSCGVDWPGTAPSSSGETFKVHHRGAVVVAI